MSKGFNFTMKGTDAALEAMRERRRKKQAAVSSSVDELARAISPDPTSKARGTKRSSDDGAWAANSISVTVPYDACAHDDPRPHREQISKLLWPADRNALDGLKKDAFDSSVDHILIGLQGAIYMAEKVKSLKGCLKDLRARYGGLEAENGVLTTAKEDLERIVQEMQVQLDAGQRDLSRMKVLTAKVESLKGTVAQLTEQLDFMATDALVTARAEMAREYEAGKASSWDLESIYAAYDEMIAARAEDAAQIDDLAASVAGMDTQDPTID